MSSGLLVTCLTPNSWRSRTAAYPSFRFPGPRATGSNGLYARYDSHERDRAPFGTPGAAPVVLSPRGHFGDLQSLASTDRIYRRDLTMRAIANNPKWIANFPYRAYSVALNCRGMRQSDVAIPSTLS